MKASELRPGQFFKFVDCPTRYRRVKHESRCVYYIDAECQLHWCAPDLEVVAVAGWDDEPEPSSELLTAEQLFKACAAKVESFDVKTQEWITPEPQPFQLGDLVTCIDRNCSLAYGSVHEVAAVDGHAIELVGQTGKTFSDGLLRPATAEEAEAHRRPFRAGDLVVCVEELSATGPVESEASDD